jgi:hypothetical protein
MPISLMTDIPNQLVIRRIENIMQGNRHFDNTQACSEVSAIDRYNINDEISQFLTYLPDFVPGEFAKLFGRVDGIK